MKKILLLLISLFITAVSQVVMADDTDLSKYDHAFYAAPDTVEAGNQCVLSLRLKNSTAITSFQFDLTIPDGMTYALDEDSMYLVEQSEVRTTKKKMTNFGFNLVKPGVMRVLCSTMQTDPNTNEMYTYEGNDGEICTVAINVPLSFSPGQYPIKVSDVILMHTDNTKVEVLDTVTTTLTVLQGFDGTVLDENSTVAPTASDGTVNVKVKRTIYANRWSTICLPFAMTGEQVKSAFGDDVAISNYTGWDDSDGFEDGNDYPSKLTVTFERVNTADGIEANHPYIIKTTKDIQEFTASGVTINPSDNPQVSTGSFTRQGRSTIDTRGYFTGNYTAGFTVPEKNLFLAEGKFWYSVGKTKMKAYRAYFEFADALQSYYDNTGAAAKVNISIDDTATGIESIGTDETIGNDKVYTVDGRYVGNGMKSLPKGLYIVNGKKVVIYK